MKRIGIFNDEGIRRFSEFLARLKSGEDMLVPVHLLDDAATSTELVPAVEVEDRNFTSRMEAAEYLGSKLGGLREVNHNRGLWAWLTLFYFDRVCPPDSDGNRTVKDEALYIPGTVSWRYYRHLLAGPFRIFQLYETGANLLLRGPVDELSDLMEQFASRQELITNRAIIGAANALYYDPEKQRPKRGAASTKKKPGTSRRFVDVVQQFDLTYDLYAMEPGQLLDLLPPEFFPWLRNPSVLQ
jgi:hypothetical protein